MNQWNTKKVSVYLSDDDLPRYEHELMFTPQFTKKSSSQTSFDDFKPSMTLSDLHLCPDDLLVERVH